MNEASNTIGMERNLKAKIAARFSQLDPNALKLAQQNLEMLLNAQVSSLAALLQVAESRETDTKLRSIAIWLLGQLRISRSVMVLVAAFEEEEPELFWEAAKSLASIKGKKALPRLVKALLSASSMEKRVAASYALGWIGDTRAFPYLESVILDKRADQRLRGQVAEALGLLRDARAVAPLTDCIKDESPEVRFWSVYALGQLGDARALAALKEVKATDHVIVPGWGRISDEAADAIKQIRLMKSV